MKQTFFAVAALMLFGFASPAYSDNINSFILYPEGPYALLPLDYATGINNVGQIVAGNCFYNRAQGSCTNLPIGPQAINDKGQMAGTDNSTAFTYIGGSVTYLAVPGATYSFANGINNATQVVGTYLWPVPNSDRFYNANGFLYSGGAYTIISFPGDTASCTILALGLYDSPLYQHFPAGHQ